MESAMNKNQNPTGEGGAEKQAQTTSISNSHYKSAGGVSQLSNTHLRILREESGLSDEVINARGYRTITDAYELAVLGFAPAQCRSQQIPGLLLPIHTTDGGNSLYQYRP